MRSFLILLLWLTGCATQAVRIELDIDKFNLDALPPHKLAESIIQKTKLYALSKDPLERNNLSLTLGYLYYRKADFTKARYYLTAIKDYSLQDYAYFYLGRMALDEKNCTLAKMVEEKLLESFKESSTLFRLQEELEKECPLPESKLSSKERIKKKTGDLYKDASQNFEDRNYSSAIAQFQAFLIRAEKNNPNVSDAFVSLATIYKRLNRIEDYLKILWKLAKYEKAHEKEFPYNPKWLYEIAKFHWNKEDIALSKRYLKKLTSWPHHRYVGSSYFILAKIMASEKKYREAMTYLEKASESDFIAGLNEEIQYLKGWYAYKLKDWTKAAEVFEEFKKEFLKSDYYTTVVYWLGRTYDHLGEPSKSLYQEIIEENSYSYYAIRAFRRLKKTPSSRPFKPKEKFSYSKNALRSINPAAFKKAETLIYMGLGEDGAYELKESASFKTLLNTSWKFQYYMANLYSLSHDFVSSFILLNKLQNSYMDDLPREHLLMLYPKRYWTLIETYAKLYNLDPYLILSIMRQESAFDPKAISPADAYGLLQITPYMAKEMGKRLNLPIVINDDLLDPEINLKYCVFYISELLKDFDQNLVLTLASYNSSEEVTKKWVNRLWVPDIEEFIEEIPYKETRSYVKLILRNYANNYFIHEGIFKVFPEALED